jgi:hypothetical protein
MVGVAVEVQRQIQPGYQGLLQLPRPRMRHPAHPSVAGHPRRQGLLAVGEGEPLAAAHPPQLQPELGGQYAAEGES